LNAGADFAQPLGAFANDGAEAAGGKCQRCGQTADTGAGDDDVTPFGHGLLSPLPANGSGRRGLERMTWRIGFARLQSRIVSIQSRAIGTHLFVGLAHIEKYMRVVERRSCADAHELPDTDRDRRHAAVVLEMRDDGVGHFTIPVGILRLDATIAILVMNG